VRTHARPHNRLYTSEPCRYNGHKDNRSEISLLLFAFFLHGIERYIVFQEHETINTTNGPTFSDKIKVYQNSCQATFLSDEPRAAQFYSAILSRLTASATRILTTLMKDSAMQTTRTNYANKLWKRRWTHSPIGYGCTTVTIVTRRNAKWLIESVASMFLSHHDLICIVHR